MTPADLQALLGEMEQASNQLRAHADLWVARTMRHTLHNAANKLSSGAAAVREMARNSERLQMAERVLRDFENAACLSELLGEYDDGCTCMRCQSRGYFAAIALAAASPTPEAT